jgi:hypothetical protein
MDGRPQAGQSAALIVAARRAAVNFKLSCPRLCFQNFHKMNTVEIIGRSCIDVPLGVSKREEDGRRRPALRASHPKNGRKTVLGVARPPGMEGLGMAGPGETSGSPWPPLAIRL